MSVVSPRRAAAAALAVLPAVVACASGSTALPAPTPVPTTTLLARLGVDTVAVEQFTRTATHMEGTLVTRFPLTRMTRYAVPHMIEKGWGRIVNVTTRLSTMNRSGGSPYGASKAALEMASEIWLKDLAGTGVTVNILNPGAAADTPGFATPEEKRVATASGRLHMMQPDRMRAPIVWLVSHATDGINGMRYDAVAWDAARPAAEQAALHGRPLGFELKQKAGGEEHEVRDDRPATGTEARFGADR